MSASSLRTGTITTTAGSSAAAGGTERVHRRNTAMAARAITYPKTDSHSSPAEVRKPMSSTCTTGVVIRVLATTVTVQTREAWNSGTGLRAGQARGARLQSDSIPAQRPSGPLTGTGPVPLFQARARDPAPEFMLAGQG